LFHPATEELDLPTIAQRSFRLTSAGASLDEARLLEYYTVVADGIPLPILQYKYPGAVTGIGMDSGFIIRIS